MGVLNSHEFDDAIKWNKTGDAICIFSKPFTDKVLTKHFQGTKFESFTRKLNRWGFKRAIDESFPPSALIYRHKFFQRDVPDLMSNMKGSKKKEPSIREKLWQEQLSNELRPVSTNSQQPVLPFGGTNLLLSSATTTSAGLYHTPLSLISSMTSLQSQQQLPSNLQGAFSSVSYPGQGPSQMDLLLANQRASQLVQQQQGQARDLQLRLLLVNQQEELTGLSRAAIATTSTPPSTNVSSFLSSRLQGAAVAPLGGQISDASALFYALQMQKNNTRY